MAHKNKYFIANWKMYGDFSSFRIINLVNNYIIKNKSKSKVIFCVPSILISHFSNRLKKSKILIGAQNCHELNKSGPYTGAINSKMIKNAGAKYVIIGHSENRNNGDTDKLINAKIKSAISNGLVVIFCIGESFKQRKQNQTNKILSLQINKGLNSVKKINKIIVSYEPVWSIGTGKIPTQKQLNKAITFISNKLNNKFKNRHQIKIIYGGSVNESNIKELAAIKNIDGFLIGGASQSPKKFIDILKNCYM